MLRQNLYRILVGLIIGLWTVSCGNTGKSASVDIVVTPSQPSVITGNYKVNDSLTVTAPWFAFQATVTNNSDTTVTIIGLQLTTTAISSNGVPITSTGTIDPSSSNFTLACGTAGATQQITYTDFGQYAPGESKPLTLTYRGPPGSCGTIPDIVPLLYLGNNPSTASGAVSYNYSVQLTPIGWFGTINAPVDRLTKTVYFSTH